jgi:ATP-dependent DNA ligase
MDPRDQARWRKTNLARLLARRPDGIFVAPFEQGEIGPDLFRAACNMGLEGLVSKRSDRPYRGGRSPHRIKVKMRIKPSTECSGHFHERPCVIHSSARSLPRAIGRQDVGASATRRPL